MALGVFAEKLISERQFTQLVTIKRLMASDLIALLTEEAVQEGLAKGLARGLAESRAEGRREIVLRLLRHKLGDFAEPVSTRVASLPAATLETLDEDLLDFTSLSDLTTWLDTHVPTPE